MRIRAAIAVVAWLIAHAATTAAESPPESPAENGFTCLGPDSVTVQTMLEPLPADSTALETYLWDHFIGSDLCGRFDCLVHRWRELWPAYAETLVVRAEAAGLDGASLRTCLAAVRDDVGRNAYLPIGASRAVLRGEPVWVILVKWEWADASLREVLGHTRAYVLDAKDGRRIFLASCS
ncbi:MAG TPA: hypothetical protein PLU44_09685 [Candidatus Krumholzibacteria bacterium]|nr:hypothetical protein [Candidatus Krumholzibacteria bacterium]